MFPVHPSSTSARVEEPTGKTKALQGSKVSKSENYCARPTRARATPSPSSACAHTAWADALCCFPSPTRWAAAQTWARRALLGLTPPDPTRSLCPGTQVLKCLLLTRGSGSPPWKASSMNSVSAPCPPPPRWAVPCPSRGQSCQPIRPTLQRGRAKGLPPGIGGQAGTPSLVPLHVPLARPGPSPCTTGPLASIVFAHLPGNPFPGQAPDLPSRDHGCTEGAVLEEAPGHQAGSLPRPAHPSDSGQRLATSGAQWAQEPGPPMLPRSFPTRTPCTGHSALSLMTLEAAPPNPLPHPTERVQGSREELAGQGQGRGARGPSPGTHPACFSYLGLRLDMDGPERALGR